mmetsp:Transcript_11634/g.31263  ORF Transcript_11634/g.31263 Transcript_11634/m.31263 type:complete len:91 (+) Transcript_11634:2835-3107(+)
MKSFGIHLGWAIEGAIGSNMKIDASYLSPHVNISSRLEAATKQYGVMMLISGEVVKHIKSDLYVFVAIYLLLRVIVRLGSSAAVRLIESL